MIGLEGLGARNRRVARVSVLVTATLIAGSFASSCAGPETCQAASSHNMNPKHENRLANETSPYLLQHAHNPVDWFPWGEEAFERAQNEDKPIFLSIGYSTCHWCHVMERESFEDEEVARLMNEVFVSIKVDREERPDVDHIYMTVTQAMTGSGGWPMTVMLTPDRKPFFAGTYFPKATLVNLVRQVRDRWQDQRAELIGESDRIAEGLRQYLERSAPGDLPNDIVATAADSLMESYEPQYGGFGSQPKFPTCLNLIFLLRAADRTGKKEHADAALRTLRAMRHGGIFDQVGFGLHRYSTDVRWRVPHFEKMLYDQALAVMAYVEAFEFTRDPFYRRTAEEILEYVERDLRDEPGGFQSAQDADSEGVEGKYYVWTEGEIEQLLTPDEAKRAKRAFQTSPNGNYADEASGRSTGTNILELSQISHDEYTKLQPVREKLLKARYKRVQPIKDDKVLTDWNGLMIAAASQAGASFDEPRWTQLAKGSADFVLAKAKTDQGLLHIYAKGRAKGEGQLTDYAFLIWGLASLYEATFDVAYLRQAKSLAEEMIQGFWDSKLAGFHMVREGTEHLLARPKETYDGAIPSGNSVAAYALALLARLTGDAKLEETARKTVRAFGADLAQRPTASLGMVTAHDLLAGGQEVVVVGEPNDPATKEMLAQLRTTYSPRKVVLLKTPSNSEVLAGLAAFTSDLSAQDGKPTAYVCRNFACELPTTSPFKARSLLERAAK
ncbi:MAG: thioredoxin domain-containing protein [Fimbriimonadaceae bacterium]|nr:thioredoxin domain-containing protein [Fimbriimonadaceae bacterium]